MAEKEFKEEKAACPEENITIINDLKEDGTRVEGYIDNRDGKAHFMTFDSNGKMIRSVHGYFR